LSKKQSNRSKNGWRKKNKYKYRLSKLREKLKKLGVYYEGLEEEMLSEFLGNGCLYCTDPPLASTASVDHSWPLSRGGKNVLENLLVVHNNCNKRKGVLSCDEYLSLLELLNQFPEYPRKDLLKRLQYAGSMYYKH